ncbi:MAG TPA: mannosyltransferase family protein [Thermoleophilia bacterium]|nr:mannosyltransferase family protein [Thermoleophilia bacterium]
MRRAREWTVGAVSAVRDLTPGFLRARTNVGLALQVFVMNKFLVVLVSMVANWEGWRRLLSVDMAYEVLVRNYRFFDAGWYVGIAANGYVHPKETAFFPLFPLTMRLFGWVLPVGFLAAGVLVSNLAFFGLLYGFARLARHDLDEQTARRAVWLLGLYPTSFYFSAAYTEALFGLATVLALYSMRRRRWALAGVAGGAAALTRNVGVLLVLPFLLEYWSSLREGSAKPGKHPVSRSRGRRSLASVLWVGVIGAGGLLYVAFLRWRFGEPFAFVNTQSLYGRESLMPWSTLYRGYRFGLQQIAAVDLPITWHDLYFTTQLFFVTLVLVVLVASVGRMRWSYWVVILYSFTIPMVGPSTEGVVDYFISFSRYSVVILPLFLGLAGLLRNRRLCRAYVVVSVGLLVLFVYAWSVGTWVA